MRKPGSTPGFRFLVSFFLLGLPPVVLFKVAPGGVVAAAESVAIVVANVTVNRRMPEPFVMFGVPAAVIVNVVVGGINAGAEALPLHIVELAWRLVPRSLLIRMEACRPRCCIRPRGHESHRGDEGNYKS